jgi:hypothetical protein
LFIWNVRCYKLSIESIGIFTDDVQVNVGGLGQGGFAANEHALIVWILLNDGALQDRFDHVGSFKALLQGMPDRMTPDEVMALTDTFSNRLDIHSRYSDAFSFYFLRLTVPRTASRHDVPVQV